MAKVLVMYFSKHGSTQKYAEWIASELNGDVYNIKNKRLVREPLKWYDKAWDAARRQGTLKNRHSNGCLG